MNGRLKELFKTKEKLFKEMYDYVKSVHFEYTEDEIESFGVFVQNLSVHTRAIDKLQTEINGFSKMEYEADKDVCEIEKRCKMLAEEVYKIDKKVNDKMSSIFGEIKSKYVASKNQQRYYNFSSGMDYISESYASFDAKQ